MSNNEGVQTQRNDYRNAVPEWRLITDVCEGERAVKNRRTQYLPKPNPYDRSDENIERYHQYLARAVFYNATGRTLQGLTGSVFRRWPMLTVPDGLRYVEDDIDGAGVSIYQQSQKVLTHVLQKGRHGLLVDYPKTEAPVSKAQQEAGLIRAGVLSINAEQIINWRTERVGAVQRLSMLVIKEEIETPQDDGFSVKATEQYRVLRLREGIYIVEVWRKGEQGFELAETHQPRDGWGKPWNEIPFTFVGAENNDSSIDRSPMGDLARLNLAHYRNSADYEDSCYFVGQAQPWISGLSEEWRNHLQESGVYIGSRTPLLLPEGGAFGFAQAQPNSLVKEAMDQKERQMVALGARLVEKGQAIKTATEAQAENEAQHSVLSLVANNISEAYTLVMSWMARYMRMEVGEEEARYELNQEFVDSILDASMLTALISTWQSGRLPSSDLWNQFRKYGVVDPEKNDEMIKEELEGESVGLGLDED